MQKKNLTVGLILLIFCIGLVGTSGGIRNVSGVEKAYRPYFEKYPSLSYAVILFQVLLATGICAWVYSAWLLYNRETGTLGMARNCFLLGSILRVAGGYSILLFGGLPPAVIRDMFWMALPATIGTLLFTSACYYYLSCSEKVKAIYSA